MPSPASLVLHFAVADTGIGIPPDRLGRIFQSFSQVPARPPPASDWGHGIGPGHLQTPQRDYGRMLMKSTGVPGKGATFNFTIQAEPVAMPVVTRQELLSSQPELAGKRILAVDDNDTNRRILVLQTRSWGMLARTHARPGKHWSG